MIPAEFELTLAEKNEIAKGITGKKWAIAQDATVSEYDGQIWIKFPVHANRIRGSKMLRGTYEQIVQYLIDMYPPLEPDCPRIHKGNRTGSWSDTAVDLFVDKKLRYPGDDINRIAALLKKHGEVYIEKPEVYTVVLNMFPFIRRQDSLLIYEKVSKARKTAFTTRQANRIKRGQVGWWDVRLLYDEYLCAFNCRYRGSMDVTGWYWPRTVEGFAERAMKLAAFSDRSGIRPKSKRHLTNLKKYIPGLLKRPEPFWRKFGRWLKKRIAKK